MLANGDDRSLFDVINSEPGGMDKFSAGMRSHNVSYEGDVYQFIASGYDWASVSRGPVVDLGGGNGHIAVVLAEAFPDLTVIIQDLATNEQTAKAFITRELKDRVKFQTQDLFTPQPQELNAKAYFLKAALHDWPDDECVKILIQLLPEVERGAKILVCDRVLPED